MSLRSNIFYFTGCKPTFFGAVFQDVNYKIDPAKIYLSEHSPEVIKNKWFFINQEWWTTHFFQWTKKWEMVMVKLKWWYYFLFREYIWKTKWVITLKCKDIFERANDDEIINYLVKDLGINNINPKMAKNLLNETKNKVTNKVEETLSLTKKTAFTIEQPGWTTHYVRWKMVKLKDWLLDLLLQCIDKTKWKISLKCKQVFERWNLIEIKEFIKCTKENDISSDYDLVHN